MDYFIRWAHDMTYAVTGGSGTSIIPDYPFQDMLNRIQTYLEEAGIDEGFDVPAPQQMNDFQERLDELQNAFSALVRTNDFQEQIDELQIEALQYHQPDTSEDFNQRYAFMIS